MRVPSQAAILAALLVGCASSSSATAPMSCPRLPTVAHDEPIFMHFPWSGWLHQRGDSAESMPLGDFETLDECRAAAAAMARANRDLVNARAATYRCGRQCRQLHERISSSPYVCEEDIEGRVADLE